MGILIKVKLTDLKWYISTDLGFYYLDLFPQIRRQEHCGHWTCASGFPEHWIMQLCLRTVALIFKTIHAFQVSWTRWDPPNLWYSVRCTIQHKPFVWADFSSCRVDKRPFKQAEHKRVMCCANAKANYWGEKWKTSVKMSRIPCTSLVLQDFWHLSEAKSYRSASLHTFHIRTMAARFKWQVLLSPLGQNPFQQYLNSLNLL